jgi:hypothetical protein
MNKHKTVERHYFTNFCKAYGLNAESFEQPDPPNKPDVVFTKESFVVTGIAIACLIDLARLPARATR